MQKITAQKIISKYDNIFLDAFGVLLNSSGLIVDGTLTLNQPATGDVNAKTLRNVNTTPTTL